MFLGNEQSSKINACLDDSDDVASMKRLLKAIVRRAANLTALQIYALTLKCARPNQRVCITIEGTTYYKVPKLEKQTLEFLHHYLSDVDIEFETMNVTDAVMKGCAAIGLQS